MQSSQILNETLPLQHKYVLNLLPKTKVRITTKNNRIVEGVVAENPKYTAVPDWLELINCTYIQPKSFGITRKLTYHKEELLNLTVLSSPVVLTKQKALVMDTFVVTKELQLMRVMQSLKLVETVGLAFHGVQVGRIGTVGWISLNCRGNLINIDVEYLGANKDKRKAWPILQKYLFENQAVKKVVHDVRPIADYLYHQHAIKIVNVLDTQIAEYYVDPPPKPERPNSNPEHDKKLLYLDELFAKYLPCRVIREEIDLYKAFRSIARNEALVSRPFTINENAKAIAISVKYLLDLEKIFSQKLMQHYTSCVASQMSSIIDGNMVDMINFLGMPEHLSKMTAERAASTDGSQLQQ